MEKRFSVLRTVATIYKILGIIAGVITILAVLGFCASAVLSGTAIGRFNVRPNVGPMFGPMVGYGILGVLAALVAGILGIVYGGGLAVTLYAIGEGIYLLLAMEENTRATRLLLQQQAGSTRPESEQGSQTPPA